MLVISRDLPTEDAYVLALRSRRIAAWGVPTCGAALDLERKVRLGSVLLDVLADEDWEGCRMLRRTLPADVPLLVLTSSVAPDREFRTLARAVGCAGFIQKVCPIAAVVNALERLASGEQWVEHVQTPMGAAASGGAS